MIGDTIKRNSAGEIIAFRDGATFTGKDRPYQFQLHDYEFFWDGEEYDAPVRIMAITPLVAWEFFAEQYRWQECEDLRMAERIVTFEDIPILGD